MKIKILLLALSALMTCGTVLADNDKEAQDVAEFRKLLTDSLSKANVTT